MLSNSFCINPCICSEGPKPNVAFTFNETEIEKIYTDFKKVYFTLFSFPDPQNPFSFPQSNSYKSLNFLIAQFSQAPCQ